MKLSASDVSFQVCCALFLGIGGIVVAYPLIYVISCSLSSPAAIAIGKVVLLPVDFNLGSYKAVLNHALLRSGFVNSLFYVAGGTTVAVSLVLLCAYPLSRRDFPDRKFFLTYFMITMFFSGGLIPSYLLMRNLHLVGSRWALVIGAGFSCYNMIIVKSYFQSSLPAGLLDAAHIDGCGDTRFFLTIALPLATPVIAVMILFNAVGIWNSYFSGMIFLTKSNTFSFQMILRDILFVSQMPPDMTAAMDPSGMVALQELFQQLRYSVLVVGALPMMILYPFIQRYFIRGMMIGSLKE
jgi:ABC-type glycerol-3-phosphate transport system permease component